jgi:hypothetical protein
MATLPRDWNEFIASLNMHRVRYLVVGAHALAANGRPRATQDLDVFIDRSKTNLERLASALRTFGFAQLASECDTFAEPSRMATLGAPPLRIDIMNHIDGVTFRDAWKGRLLATFGDHEVPFLGLAELRANKLASGRAKDLADLALIEEMEHALARPQRVPKGTTERASQGPKVRKRSKSRKRS